MLLPWAVAGKVTSPHTPVFLSVAGQLSGVQLPTVAPNAPLEHGALTVPEHPAGQVIAGVLLPWAVAGKVTSPHVPVFLKMAGQLSPIHPSVNAKKVPFPHVALADPVHPAPHVISVLTSPWVVAGIVAASHCEVGVDQAGQSRKQVSLTATKLALEHLALYAPVQPVGQDAAELITPLFTAGNINPPQLAVVIGVAGQLRGIHASVTGPKVPALH